MPITRSSAAYCATPRESNAMTGLDLRPAKGGMTCPERARARPQPQAKTCLELSRNESTSSVAKHSAGQDLLAYYPRCSHFGACRSEGWVMKRRDVPSRLQTGRPLHREWPRTGASQYQV